MRIVRFIKERRIHVDRTERPKKSPCSGLFVHRWLVDDEPDENGITLAEFYPVDQLLELRQSDKVLAGHPLLDIDSQEDEDPKPAMVAHLRPTQTAKVRKIAGRGSIIALGRGVNRRTGREWVRFHDVDPTAPPANLSEADLHWLAMVCENGAHYCDQLKAAQAFEQLAVGLYRVAARAKPKGANKKQRKQKGRKGRGYYYDNR